MLAAAALLAATALLVTACEPDRADSGVTPAPTSSPTALTVPVLTAADLTPRPPPPAMGRPLPDERVAEILDLWLEPSPDPGLLAASLDEIEKAVDLRFVAPLIEMTWGTQLQVVHYDERHTEVLHALTNQTYGRDWERWVAWYGSMALEPVPGFVPWKGRLLSFIDPRFGEFLASGAASTIRPELIAWGGVTVDGIFPLMDPPAVAADHPEAAYLAPDEPVLGLVVNGEARAYPYRIMDPHEMANDVLGGVPISIAHCTLCGSAIAYDGRGRDGVTYRFSTSGLLYESNKLMYDLQTRTLWNQFTGRPVLGPLVDVAGDEPLLDAFPLVTTTWEAWRREHPETTVLSLNTGAGSGYTLGFPYLQYYTGGNPVFPLSDRDLRLNAHDWVYGLVIEEAAQAYDVRLLVSEQVVQDEVAGIPVVLVADGEFVDVDAFDRLNAEATYRIGATVRAFAAPPGVTFSPGGDAGVVIDQDGAPWRVTEEALVAADGRTAERLFGRQAFWFAWYTFHPETGLRGGR